MSEEKIKGSLMANYMKKVLNWGRMKIINCIYNNIPKDNEHLIPLAHGAGCEYESRLPLKGSRYRQP